jgi:hypothetical protein
MLLPDLRRISNLRYMHKKNPVGSALIDLEWARVYAGRIQHELKLIGKTLRDHNAHVMNAELVKGATVLKAQMKQASQQVGGMSKIAAQSEKRWMTTIKKALQTKYADTRKFKA